MKLELESSAPQNSPASVACPADSGENGFAREAENLINSAIKFAKDGDAVAARRTFLRAVELDPLSEAAWLWLASLSEYPEELIVFLQKVLAINPANERALEWMRATESMLSKTFVRRGMKAAQESRREFARQCFRQAIEHDEANEIGWLWLASLSEAKEEKVGYLRKALELNPANETARETLSGLENRKSHELLQRATSAAISGDREEARRLLGEILADSPEMEEAWILQAYLAENFYEKMSAYEQVLGVNPENEAAQAGLASLRAMQKAKEFKNPLAAKPEPFGEKVDILNAEKAIELNAEKAIEISEFSAEAKEARTEEAETNQAASVALAEETGGEAAQEETMYFYAAEEPQTETAAEFDLSADAETDFQTNQSGAEDFVSLAAETDDFEHPTQELDRQALISADEVFAQHSASHSASSAFLEADSTTENFEPAEYSFAANTTQEAPDKEADDEEFARLLDSEDADAVELLDASDRNDEDFASANNYSDDSFGNDDSSLRGNPAPELRSDALPGVFGGALEVTEAAQDSDRAEFFDAAADDSNPVESDALPSSCADDFIPMPASDFALYSADRPAPDQNSSSAAVAETEFAPSSAEAVSEMDAKPANDSYAADYGAACPFCAAPNESQAFVCRSCSAMLSLADLESMLVHHTANPEVMLMAINDLEAEKLRRGLSVMQLTDLGIAYLNTGERRKGLEALRSASQMSPNNVVLGSKVNYLAIRLAEIEAQDCKTAESPVKCKTILVVDDSPTVRKLISGKLEKSGHTVVCAVDGLDALSKVGEQTPDLILLDINMPKMDGYQVCKLIRGNETTKEIPVVMISGKDGFFDKVRGRMAGSTGYITKPFGPETLMRTLETYLN